MRPRLVIVLWKDIVSDCSWQPKDNVDIEPALCKSVGWLIEKNEETIKIAGSQNSQDWGDVTCIPTVNVIEIKNLRKK